MVSVGSLTLVAIMTVEGARSTGVTGGAVRLWRDGSMMGIGCCLACPVIRRVVAILAIVDRLHLSVAALATGPVGTGRVMMSGLDIPTMAADTTGKGLHGRVAGGAIDRVVWIAGGCMVRSPDLTLVASEAVRKVPDIGVTLCAVAGNGGSRVMMAILLRNKGVAGRTITVGGDTLVTLVTQPLRIELRLMMACRYIRAMARIAIPWCGK